MKFLTSLCLAMLFPSACLASGSFPLLSLTEVSVKYQQFLPGAVDPMITNAPLSHQLDKELNLTVDADVFKYGYWHNVVHSQTDQFQFRKVGWEIQLGVRAGKYLDLYYEHWSQHLLDAVSKEAFPRQDGLGLRIYLYRRGQ